MNRIRSDKDRFAHLMRPHFDALYAAAQRLTMSPADAEDLVQDVCLKAFLRIEELAGIEFQRAWLLKILYHQFIDMQRARGRSPVDLADTGSDSKEPENFVPEVARPEELVDREMLVDKIVRAMTILNSDLSVLLALHDIEGFTLEEMQELNGLPIGTMKSRLYRARSKLGRLLSNKELMRPALAVVANKK